LVGLDRVPELGVAHDEQSAVGERRHGRGAYAAIDHADLAEEVAWIQDPPLLAVDVDLRPAFQLDVEGVARSALADQRLARLDVHLVALPADELQLPSRAVGEQWHPAERGQLGIVHGHILKARWCGRVRSAGCRFPKGPGSAPTAGLPQPRSSRPKRASWARSSSPIWCVRPSWPRSATPPNGHARSLAASSTPRPRS